MKRISTHLAGLALAFTLGAGAQIPPPLTLIQDTLYKADGSLFSGAAIVSWRSFVASDGSNIPQNTLTIQIQGGAFRARLVPTTNATSGAYYTVRFNADGRTQFTEVWAVPPSSTALPIRTVRLDSVPGAPVQPPASLIQISDVTGLPEALVERPLKALAFQPSRTAIIDTNGDIAAATGVATDCVRVNGTSGPCGSAQSVPLFIDLESPTGSINGVNRVFTLNQAPSPAASLHVYRNGILQRVSVDYTLSGNTLTFQVISTPQTGDVLAASYRAAP